MQHPVFLDEDSSVNQQVMSLSLVFDSVKKNFFFRSLNDSISFGTVDYDAHINTTVDYFINHVFYAMTIQKLTTLFHIRPQQKI